MLVVDWIQDTLVERARRRVEAETSTRTTGATYKAMFWRIVESGQSWFVVSLVGNYSFQLVVPGEEFS